MKDKTKKRVVDEKKALDNKIAPLRSFLNTETFSNLPDETAELLRSQIAAMSWYSNILGSRIQEFTR